MSGFTSFLKKFGADAVKLAENLIGSPKVIVQDIAQGSSDFKSFFDLLKQSERIANTLKLASPAGSQKLAMIQPDVAAIIADVETLGAQKIGDIVKDQAAFNQGIQDLISAGVKILNACGD